jgi:hypothetical protein
MRLSVSLCLCGFLLAAQSAAQEKKDDKAERPTIKLVQPFAVASGVTSKLAIRGIKLDETTEIKTGHDKAHATIVGKGKVTVPGMVEQGAVGDTQVAIELVLEEDLPTGDLLLTLVTPAGETATTVPIVDQDVLVESKEPQNGFSTAQVVQCGKMILGSIEKPKDVDVVRIELESNQTLTAEVHAARHGSPLDAMLSLYDSNRRLLAENDDRDGKRDPRIKITPPAAGVYYLSLIDANDQGSPLHAYRLTLRVE